MANTTEPIDLSAQNIELIANAGDDIYIPVTVEDTDTTGWTLECPVYLANDLRTGPTGNSIGSGTIVNTPGDPDSDISFTIAGTLTTAYQNKTLWFRLRRTDSGQVRTYVTGIATLA